MVENDFKSFSVEQKCFGDYGLNKSGESHVSNRK